MQQKILSINLYRPLWQVAKIEAARRGISIAELVRRSLKEYLGNGDDLPELEQNNNG